MEPVRGRRVSQLRASLAEYLPVRLRPGVVQGEPFHTIQTTSYSADQTFWDIAYGIPVAVAEVVAVGQAVAQAERQLELDAVDILNRNLNLGQPVLRARIQSLGRPRLSESDIQRRRGLLDEMYGR